MPKTSLHAALAHLDADGVLTHGPSAVLKLQQADASGDPLTAKERDAAEQFLALLQAAFLVAAADHQLSDRELEQLSALFFDLSAGEIPQDVIDDWFDLWAEGLVREGFHDTARRLGTSMHSDEFRRMAFVAAAGIAYVDGEIHDAEVEMFHSLAEAFRIPRPEAALLLEQVHAQMGVALKA
jgi:uncharacterized tellurite resistance protein B-like protein